MIKPKLYQPCTKKSSLGSEHPFAYRLLTKTTHRKILLCISLTSTLGHPIINNIICQAHNEAKHKLRSPVHHRSTIALALYFMAGAIDF